MANTAMAAPRNYDLEERLLEFSAAIVRVSERVVATRAGQHVSGQLLRSGTSPFLNHGEAQAAESADDFVHKMSICLKELRETRRCLRLIQRVPLIDPPMMVGPVLREAEELVRIFYASIRTARHRKLKIDGSNRNRTAPDVTSRSAQMDVGRSKLDVGRSGAVSSGLDA